MINKTKTPLKLAAATLILGTSALVSTVAHSATLDIEITNLTQAIVFTPFLVTTHSDNHLLFESGTSASNALQSMAEGGNITALVANATAAGAMVVTNPNEGLLMPGQKVASFSIEAAEGAMLSLVAMLLPTNDGFAGLDSWTVPAPGTYTINVNAYDAGTEVNNELIVAGAGGPGAIGIPADPGGMAGTGGSGVTSTEENMMIHIHRGNLGDDDQMAGISDLNNTVHRWLNPVLKVTITVK